MTVYLWNFWNTKIKDFNTVNIIRCFLNNVISLIKQRSTFKSHLNFQCNLSMSIISKTEADFIYTNVNDSSYNRLYTILVTYVRCHLYNPGVNRRCYITPLTHPWEVSYFKEFYWCDRPNIYKSSLNCFVPRDILASK